jgi:hypothetical protein
VQLMDKFYQQSHVEISRNECTGSTLLDPKLMFWCVSDHFVTAQKSMQNGPNWSNKCTSSCNEVTLEFFATNTTNPPHWILNSCFGAFRTVLSPHENRCKMGRAGAISAQVHEKNHVGIFRNARTQSTVLDPKLMFWRVSDRFVSAQKSMQTGRTCLISAQFFALSAPDPPY